MTNGSLDNLVNNSKSNPVQYTAALDTNVDFYQRNDKVSIKPDAPIDLTHGGKWLMTNGAMGASDVDHKISGLDGNDYTIFICVPSKKSSTGNYDMDNNGSLAPNFEMPLSYGRRSIAVIHDIVNDSSRNTSNWYSNPKSMPFKNDEPKYDTAISTLLNGWVNEGSVFNWIGYQNNSYALADGHVDIYSKRVSGVTEVDHPQGARGAAASGFPVLVVSGMTGSGGGGGGGGTASAETTEADTEIAALDNSDLSALKGAAKSTIGAKTFAGADEAEKRGKRKRYLKQFMKRMRELRAGTAEESDGKLVLDNGLPGSAFQKKTTIIEVKENPTDQEADVIPSGEMVYVPIEDGDTAKWKRGADVHTLTNASEVYTLNITSGGNTTEIFNDGAAGDTKNYSSNGVDYNLELGGGGENDAGGNGGGSGDPFITPMFN